MEKQFHTKVTSVATDEYGHQLFVTTENGEVAVFEASSFVQKSSFQIGNTAFSIDTSANEYGPLVVVGCADGSIMLFQNNRQIQQFKTSGAVLSVAFHKSKPMFAAASLDGTFSVYQKKGESWEQVSVPVTFMGLTAVCWGSEGDMLQTLIVGGVDGVIRVYKSAGGSWEPSSAIQAHDGWVRSIAAPNVPLSHCQKIASCGDDKKVCVVKVINDRPELKEVDGVDFPGSVAWAMVDKTLVIGDTNGNTTMWKEDENGQWERAV